MGNTKRPPMAKAAGKFEIHYETSSAYLYFSDKQMGPWAKEAIRRHFVDADCEIRVTDTQTILIINFRSYAIDGEGAVRRLHYFLLGLHEGWMLLSKAPAPPPEEYFTVTHFIKKGDRRELHRLYPVQGNTPPKIAGLCYCVDDDVKAWGMEVDCVEVYNSADDWAHKRKPIYTHSPIHHPVGK